MSAKQIFIGAASVCCAGYHAIAVLGKTGSYSAACAALLVALSMWFLGAASGAAKGESNE
jgi:hypothetical protein